jgi:hypothetical protein
MSDAEGEVDLVERWLIYELREGRQVTLRLSGGSMWPLIRSGERVTLEPLEPLEPRRAARVGDVCLSLSEASREGARLSALHRVIWISGDRAWLRGDALPRLDAPCPRAALYARLIKIEGASPLRAALAAPRARLTRALALGLSLAQWGVRRAQTLARR